ncbi:MAG: PASTA domain-containing protein [Acidimicrobiia bacterium]|nr:PASTA domain-containing protein [Acidimicrobiia bacterium]
MSGVSDLVGTVLADRYRLRVPIGTGGGGRVYLADDIRLRRRVAVKVLHAALAEDAGFLRRFRAEAQLAASLHHPNIMAVYDWGNDGLPFMVLEYLAGGSLRSMLDGGVRLSPAQAAHVGREVSAALEHAQERGLVHRDIKPANLLFDEHGIVRVADFGLARALAEASWTEPAGAVLGTARYAAPEQGLGTPLDGRADLYALSLVLVESVTGRVPGVADTPIGTLAGRARRSVVAPEEMGPLSAVVERAGRAEPDERYPDATTMRSALEDAAEALPPPAPLTLVVAGAVAEDANPTQMRSGTASEAASTVFDQDADAEPMGVDDQLEEASTGRRLTPWIVGAVILAALGAAAFALFQTPAATVPAPQLVGLTTDAAGQVADEVGVSIDVVEEIEAAEPAGTILEQRPAAGAFMNDDGTVSLTVSSGPPPVAIPTVTGLAVEEAIRELEDAGFLVGEQAREPSEDVPADVVISQDPPAGEEVASGSKINILISDGPPLRTVQDLAGSGYDEAAAALEGIGLVPERADEFSDDVPSGQVIGTTPAAGEPAERGSTVTVRVSKGPDLVPVPDVRGLGIDAATAALEAKGLAFDVDTTNFTPGAPVVTQSPAPDTKVKRGATVTIAF